MASLKYPFRLFCRTISPVFLFMFVIQTITFSQAGSYITGKVMNSASKAPVPFAAVKLKTNQLGVYANAEGDFMVACNSDFKLDSLVVTCIGYKRLAVAFSDLSDSTLNRIYLVPSIYGLKEVKISASRKKLNPSTIVGRAVRNIRKNCPGRPFSYISYYRDYQKREKTYFNLNEAIIQTLDNGFSEWSVLNKYRLLDFRKNISFPVMSLSPFYDSYYDPESTDKIIPNATLGDQYGNELFILMVHDALRNYRELSFSFVDVLSDNFVMNHTFSDPVTVFNNNLKLLSIDFSAKKRLTGDSLQVAGTIFIQPKDYSIHKLEYKCFYLRTTEKKEMFSIDIEYGYDESVDSLMCLKYISFNNYFNVIDTTDHSFFRILRSYWDISSNSTPRLVVECNNEIDPAAVSDKENFIITLGGKSAGISSLSAAGKKIYIRLKEKTDKKMRDSCLVSIRNIRDVKGNILDKRKSLELYQYRELFVQEYNKPVEFTDTCFIRYMPLDQNCRAGQPGTSRYWMNTPENIKQP
jgi:hypothetical protein